MRLKNIHKKYIINELACFTRPADVVTRVEKTFNIKVSRQQVSYYNPESPISSRDLSSKWKVLFKQTRHKFLDELENIPLAHKGYRMGELQKIFDKAKENGNIKLCCKILEQAAKEMGGYYTKVKKSNPSKEMDKRDNVFQQINQQIYNINKNDDSLQDPDEIIQAQPSD